MQTQEIIDKLREFNDWRLGRGKYKWSEDPAKYHPMPFDARHLTWIISEAINKLEKGLKKK